MIVNGIYCVLSENGTFYALINHLELQALVQHHAPLHPGLFQVSTLTVQSLQLLLDLWAGVVSPRQQLLAKLLEGLEGASPGINLGTMFLEEGRWEKE